MLFLNAFGASVTPEVKDTFRSMNASTDHLAISREMISAASASCTSKLSAVAHVHNPVG
jgi:hypothetical protein